MANLRVISHSVLDSRTIRFVFSHTLNNTITINNFEVLSQSAGIPDSSVVDLYISGKELTITTLPLTPLATYKVRLFSLPGAAFVSTSGNYLFEDEKTNVITIFGAQNPENEILDRMSSYLRKTPYDVDNPGLVKTHLENLSNVFYKAYNTIHQLRTDNYLSIDVVDEYHKRGKGPYDRLDNEGAYEIVRVGPNVTDFIAENTLTLTRFPKEPVTLQTKIVLNESLTGSNTSISGTFNQTLCTLTHSNITKITAITVVYADATVYEYDIESFGYLITDSRYDELASTYIDLETNQFKFSEKSINEGFVIPVIGDTVIVSYEYKDLGIEIDPDSIEVNEIKSVVREVCPSISTIFSLKHSKIVNSSGAEVTTGGVSFYDPHATPPFSATHPAFVREILFDENSLPNAPGLYSVDYETGKVYVYGSDTTKENVGTGPFPPVCSYYYNNQYVDGLDYTYDAGLREIVSNPLRELRYKPVSIYYKYNQNYIPGTDYEPQAHVEILSERIQNRLIGNNIIEPLYAPITNVFRIYNETTGELYRLNRFTDTQITFNFQNPPTVVKNVNERANFQQIYNETLLVSEETTNTAGYRIFIINLLNNNITNASQDAIACSFDTSLLFTDNTTFIREAYYYREQELITNLDKLVTIGDYIVDYVNGIVYVYVSAAQTYDVGFASYKTKYIEVSFSHILSVLDIYSKTDLSSDYRTSYRYGSFSDTLIDLETYKYSDNLYSETDPPTPMMVSSDTITLPENAISLRNVYEVTDLNTSYTPINFATGSSVSTNIATLVPVDFITDSIIYESSGSYKIDIEEIINNDNFEIDSVDYVRRTSDGAELYNTTLSDGSFSDGTITLPTDTIAQGDGYIGSFANNSTKPLNSGYYGKGCFDNINNRVYIPPVANANASYWHYINCNTNTVELIVNPGAPFTVNYTGAAAFDSVHNRVYFSVSTDFSGSYLHYIDTTTNSIVAFTNAEKSTLVDSSAYLGAVFNTINNRVYFAPQLQACQNYWHYIDTDTNTMVAFANISSDRPINGYAYHGAAFDPINNRIYFAPHAQSNQAKWHYIDCNTNTVVAFNNTAISEIVYNAYADAAFDPINNRVYFAPFAQADESKWHYIDCNTNTIISFDNPATNRPINGAYAGIDFDSLHNRMYFAPYLQGAESKFHYIDTLTNTIHSYNNTISSFNLGAYTGAVFNSINNNIYLNPYIQSDQDYWHYIDTTAGDDNIVEVGLTISLQDTSTVIVNYDYGGLYLDYTSLYDEIIISYEYGDNVLDFRESETINEGDVYYVTYKYGALRDALLANFGAVIAIPELNNFDVDLNRERYRDALIACMQSFPKGPTVGAIKDIAHKISHIIPEIKETLFEEWVLGSSHLYDNEIAATGTLLKGVFDYGIFFDEGNNLRVPISNHIKLEGGTIEFWIVPSWDGYHNNDSKITFCITRNGSATTNVYVGALGETPLMDANGCFTLSKDDEGVSGLPANYDTTTGIFIYYDEDENNWKLIAGGLGYTLVSSNLLFGGVRSSITTSTYLDDTYYNFELISETTKPSARADFAFCGTPEKFILFGGKYNNTSEAINVKTFDNTIVETLSSYAYMGCAFDPINRRVYLAPYDQSDKDVWHYIDCDTNIIVEYNNIITNRAVTMGYRSIVYNYINNRMYLIPADQAEQDYLHYIDCSTNTVIAYSNPLTDRPVYNAYWGGCFDYVNNRIYMGPYRQSDKDKWHYIDCNTDTIIAFDNPLIDRAVIFGYAGAAFDNINNRIYFAPQAQAEQTKYHYIDTSTNTVISFDNTNYLAYNLFTTSYYADAFFDSQNQRVYFAALLQSTSAFCDYIDTTTNSIVTYYPKIDLTNLPVIGAYSGLSYDPDNNRIYYCPFYQSDEDYWHYLDINTNKYIEYENPSIDRALNTAYTGICYDSRNKRMYLSPTYYQSEQAKLHYIQLGEDDCINDTWSWDATNHWQELSPATSPPAMYNCRMKFDGTNCILFGGKDFSSNTYANTWKYDGTTWTQLSPTTSPVFIEDFDMARYGNSKILLFGGYNSDDGYLNDTWEWDGTTWTQLSPTTSPDERCGHSMSSFGDKVIMYGGKDRLTRYEDTWVFDGDWTLVNDGYTVYPENTDGYSRLYAGIAEINSTNVSVKLVGGGDYNSVTINNNIWDIDIDYDWNETSTDGYDVSTRFYFGLDCLKQYTTDTIL